MGHKEHVDILADDSQGFLFCCNEILVDATHTYIYINK